MRNHRPEYYLLPAAGRMRNSAHLNLNSNFRARKTHFTGLKHAIENTDKQEKP